MTKAQLKLLIFLITVGLMLGSVATAYWFYMRVIRPEMQVKSELEKIQKGTLPTLDPGARRFDAAVDLIRLGDLDAGREALYQLLKQFPESPTCAEAKRIIGEINLDRLFSPTYLEGKVDYIVQPGDVLQLIASKHKTSLDAITRMNGLRGTTIHPGDHLLIMPVDFDFAVHVSEKRVIVLRQGRFFAEYPAVDVRLPVGFRVPAEIKLGMKSASLEGKPVAATDAAYLEAEKLIPGNKPGVVLRTVPVARPVEAKAVAPTGGADPAGSAEFGVFLRREDLEEVFAMARSGASLKLVK
jgi:LysM repeat protein